MGRFLGRRTVGGQSKNTKANGLVQWTDAFHQPATRYFCRPRTASRPVAIRNRVSGAQNWPDTNWAFAEFRWLVCFCHSGSHGRFDGTERSVASQTTVGQRVGMEFRRPFLRISFERYSQRNDGTCIACVAGNWKKR